MLAATVVGFAASAAGTEGSAGGRSGGKADDAVGIEYRQEQFACETDRQIDSERPTTKFTFVLSGVGSDDIRPVFPSDDEVQTGVVTDPEDSMLRFIFENWSIPTYEDRFEIYGDGDGITLTTIVLYKDSDYTRGWVRIEREGAGYSTIHCQRSELHIALDIDQIGDAFSDVAPGATYTSESDYDAEFLYAFLDEAPTRVTPELLLTSFKDDISKVLLDDDSTIPSFEDLAYEFQSESETAQSLAGLATVDPADDEYYVESAKAFARIKKLFDENLTDVHWMKVGPKGEDGKLAIDQGLYMILVVGKTVDGHLAGFWVGTVET
ncbi:MAG: hypothetical protein KC417_06420 [Myxococcales bacterium]|nr:hypothetical protein [Myxococcales bacterium]